MNRRALLIATTALGATFATFGCSALAQSVQDKFPSRPIKIVMPLPPGSGPDVRVRIVAEALTKFAGQQVVVENRPGGGGVIGTRAVLAAAPDGYTLLAGPASIFTILPAQKNKLPFDINRDLIPIGTMVSEGMVLAVSPKLGVTSLAELIARARKEPEKLVIGTNPAGSLTHLAAKLIVAQSSAPMTILPYSTGGTNAAIQDIMGGRVHVVIEALPGLKGFIDSGDLKPIAVMTSERVPTIPKLPTAAETVPGLRVIGWNVLSAPKGTPEAVTRRIADDLRKALEAPEVQKRVKEIGTPFRPLFGAELAQFIDSEQKLWWPIVSQP
jgi:tripartite-type tricarboxylate transporter receptor subunit TctC